MEYERAKLNMQYKSYINIMLLWQRVQKGHNAPDKNGSLNIINYILNNNEIVIIIL